MGDKQRIWQGSNQAGVFHCTHLPTPYRKEFLTKLQSLMDVEAHAFKLKSGKKLFWQNGPASRFYLILEGCLKETYVDQTGYESIVEFYYCNEFIGLESLGEHTYKNTAEAITTSWVSGIPCPDLKNNLFKNAPELEHSVWGLMGDAITAARRHVRLLKLSTADQKLANFLLARCERSGRVFPTTVHMPMARQDIASYLKMSAETLSRLFKRFESRGLIRGTKRHVEIIDYEGLTSLLHMDE